jgi:hypothetical protein
MHRFVCLLKNNFIIIPDLYKCGFIIGDLTGNKDTRFAFCFDLWKSLVFRFFQILKAILGVPFLSNRKH